MFETRRKIHQGYFREGKLKYHENNILFSFSKAGFNSHSVFLMSDTSV